MSTPTDPQAFHLRPRFTLTSAQSVAHICNQFSAALQQPQANYNGKVRQGYISLYPKAADRHYWSPHLSLSLESSEDQDETTTISGLYGPAPEAWTMFVFCYAIMGLAIVIVAVIGLANQSIGESGAILWAIPVLVLAFGSMYAVSYFGQRKGHDQVEGMYLFLTEILEGRTQNKIGA